jgi:hypothetical protein
MDFTIIETIQVSLLAIQASSLMYAVKADKSPLYTHGGISIYMCLPIALLNLV